MKDVDQERKPMQEEVLVDNIKNEFSELLDSVKSLDDLERAVKVLNSTLDVAKGMQATMVKNKYLKGKLQENFHEMEKQKRSWRK